MVLSREGDEREIDVAVYLPAGPRTLVIGVECRGHGRSGTKEWIDGLIGKYDGLPVDKIVAVHERGFTKGALKKAADAHIECVTLGRARQDHWLKQLRAPAVELRSRVFRIEGVTVTVDAPPPAPTFDVPSAILHLSPEPPTSVLALIKTAHTNKAIIEKVHSYLIAHNVLDVVQRFTMDLDLGPAPSISAEGRRWPLKRVELAIAAKSLGLNTEYAAATYAHSQVATFSEQLGPFEMTGVMTEPVTGMPNERFRVHIEKPLAWPSD